MKKLMMTLAAVLCCAMTTTLFTACGDDDDDKSASGERKIVGYQVDYSVSFPETFYSRTAGGNCGNLFLLYDKIEVGYIDENGKEQREVVNNRQWSKTIIYKRNLDDHLKLYLTKPASLDVESLPYEKYDQGVEVTPSSIVKGISVLYSDGTKSAPTLGNTPVEFTTTSISSAVSKSKLVDYLGVFPTEVNILHIKLGL